MGGKDRYPKDGSSFEIDWESIQSQSQAQKSVRVTGQATVLRPRGAGGPAGPRARPGEAGVVRPCHRQAHRARAHRHLTADRGSHTVGCGRGPGPS